MITPEYLNEIIYATEDAVSELHAYLIGKIAKHIASFFGDYENADIMPSNIKQMHKMLESGVVYEDIQTTLTQQYPVIEKEIKTAFYNSAAEISKANTEFEKEIIRAEKLNVKMPDFDVNNIPRDAKGLNLTDHEVRLLEADYKRTNGTVKNITKTTALSSQQAYIKACDSAMVKIQHGVSPSTAITEAITDMADKGIGVVMYNNNYAVNIETAIARAVRTGVNQANSHIVLQRCAELGVGYVKVSEHLGARVTPHDDYTNHSWWQGQVYQLNWNDPELAAYSHEAKGHIAEIRDAIGTVNKEYPDFVTTTGFGKIEGLAGINCRHSFSAFYPNIQKDPEPQIDQTENKKRYAELQQQRALERGIRKTKREIAALKGSDMLHVPDVKGQLDDAEARLKIQLQQYYDYCKAHRLNADGSRMIVSESNDIGN